MRDLHAVLQDAAPAANQCSLNFAPYTGKRSTVNMLLECCIVHMLLQDGQFCCDLIACGPLEARTVKWSPPLRE